MKYLKHIILLSIMAVSIGILPIAINDTLLTTESNDEWKNQPTDWLYTQRAFPHDNINRNAYLDAIRQAQGFKQRGIETRNATNWTFAGPLNVGGRIASLAVHPSDAQTIYIGAAAGGIFKTTNGGSTWTPVFDNSSSLSIGDIAVAHSDKNTLYVGTGEANGGGGSVNFDGLGVYKSNNGGMTWQNMGLENAGSIGKVAIDPYNPNTVFIAAMGYLYEKSPHRGIYRTKDGGATWQNVLYLSDSTGCIDVAINPQNPNIVYAAMWERIRRPHLRDYGGSTCGIYRSKDGGDTWEKLITGLPTTDIGRIGIAVSAATPENGQAGTVCYAIYADEIGFFKGLYQSTDGGNNWVKKDPANQLIHMYASFGWWFGKIYADPIEAQTVYALGLTIHRSTDGGASWEAVGSNIHVDQHALWINPNNPNQIYCGNDGGFYISDNAGNSWQHINNLPITQFYTCEIDAKNPQRLYGGSQDNGTWRTLEGGTNDWQQILGADGFVSLVNPLDNNYVYASAQNGAFYRSTNGGAGFTGALSGINSSDRKNWKTPIIMSPHNPATLYYGTNRLYRSTNHATTWAVISPDLTKGSGGGNLVYGTITAIAVSPKNPQLIYCGTDDGTVSVTMDGGINWSKITNGLPNRWVTAIEADPFDENTAYITFSGYKWRDYQPHVLRTTNRGVTWQDISGNLPEAPVNDIIIDSSPQAQKENSGSKVYYAATDFGVFVTHDGGAKWEILGSGLPLISIMDLTWHAPSRTLVAATYGRSMYRITMPDLNTQLSISGSIRREEGDTVAAQVSIFRNTLLESVNSSLFSFNQLTFGQSYLIKPYRNDNPLRGVTAFDIALLSRHILGIAPLSTPYKMIASDVNRDGELDAADLLIIRKLILRQLDTFPNNTSWRFVPKNHVFTYPNDPFERAFPEDLLITDLKENSQNADFYALKTGDVNNSATLFRYNKLITRHDDIKWVVSMPEQELQAGRVYTIPIKIQPYLQNTVTSATLAALQLAFNWDRLAASSCQLLEGDFPHFEPTHCAVFPEKGTAAMTWSNTDWHIPYRTQTLVYMVIQTRKTAWLSQIITPNNEHTEGVAFDAKGQPFPLTWQFVTSPLLSYTLFQNYPNPVSDNTKIPFHLSQDSYVSLTVSDLSGRVVMQVNRFFTQGYHEIIYHRKPDVPAGILLYSLGNHGKMETKMMLVK